MFHCSGQTDLISKLFSGDKDATSAVKDYDDQIMPIRASDRSHEGYLYKQANSVFKGWRLSYFVIEDKKTVSIVIHYKEKPGKFPV